MGVATRAGWLAAALALVVPGAASAAVTFRVETTPAPVLVVASDADDAITVTCDVGPQGSHLVVNGSATAGGCQSSITVIGGPGPNRIDLGDLQLFNGSFRGAQGYVRVDGGGGDDDISTPAQGSILATVDGGPGNDRIVGGAIDTYVFGPAAGEEVDTIVERATPTCEPTWAALNVADTSWWLVSWDTLDLRSIEGGAQADASAPGGVLATMPGRTIRLERAGTGSVTVDAILGGPGPDRLAGGCFAAGQGGDDVLVASPEGAALLGGPGSDTLRGAVGPDLLVGGPGADRIAGGDGPDSLAGLRGSDALVGGRDDDAYLFEATDGTARDRVVERPGEGRDVLSFDLPAGMPVRVDLGAPGGLLARFGEVAVTGAPGGLDLEGAIGGRGDDLLRGSSAANDLWTGGGTDVLAGGDGDDTYWVDPAAPLPDAALGYRADGFSAVPALLWRGASAVGRCASDEEACRGTYPARVVLSETAGRGDDTVVLAQVLGNVTPPTRLDLSARWRLLVSDRLRVETARPGQAAFLEGTIGTWGDDVLIGNAADNVLEGLMGRDVLAGGRGEDTCVGVPSRITPRQPDRLRSCERRTERSPYRPPFSPFTM